MNFTSCPHDEGRACTRPSSHFVASRVLRRRNVLRLHALTPLGRLVRHLGALVEGLEALTRDARVVHEEVLTTVVRGDEAVALLVTEPLYRSLGHILEPTFRIPGPQQTEKPPSNSGWRSVYCRPTLSYRRVVYQNLAVVGCHEQISPSRNRQLITRK